MTVLTTHGLADSTQPSSALQIIQWAAATGTVNAIEAAYVDEIISLEDGLALCFRASGANTSTTPTFAPDDMTAYPITKLGGKVLKAGDIPGANAEIIVRFNLANLRWEMLAFDNPTIPWAAAAGTADAITAAFPVAVTTLTDGLLLSFRATGANTIAGVTFAPDGLTARTIKKEGNVALVAGDIPGAGAEMLVRYRSSATQWELLNPAVPTAIATNNTALNLQADLWKVLTADDTGGQNINTVQPWFPTAGAVTVAASTTYFMEGLLWTTRAAGSTSHATGLAFGGTATITSMDYLVRCKEGDANDLQDVSAIWMNGVGAVTIKAASTSTTENTFVLIRGIVRVNAGGTLIPQFFYTVAPGGAPTIKRNSFFLLRPIGTNVIGSQGTWA
jgi:hypothetical protein